MIAILAVALALTSAQDATPLRLVHGDEQVVTWLDEAGVRRAGDRVRARMLRVRHADQAFWVVQEIDCAARTWALVATKTVTASDGMPPPLDGEARHMPIRHDDHSENALRDAVCEGVFIEAGVPPVQGAQAAIAALEPTKRAAVRARPLQLIVVREGDSPVFMDRATLESGGPQVEVRSLEMTAAGGVWTGWMLDCERRDLAMDRQWTAPLVDGSYGTVRRDVAYGGKAPADAMETALNRMACSPEVWSWPAHSSIEAAMEAARPNPG